MKKLVLMVVFILSFMLPEVFAALASDVARLFEDKVVPNNPDIKPTINQSDAVNVSLSFNLVAITEFNEVHQRFSCNAWLDLGWHDQLMRWNKSEYGGLHKIWPPRNKVWRPAIAVANIHNDFKTLEIKSGIVRTMFDGSVFWSPGEAFQTFCKVDVTTYPFDQQRCDIEFFIWGSGIAEVVLHPVMEKVNFQSYKENGEWKILDTKATLEMRGSAPVMSMIVISILMERRSFFYVLNIVLPVVVLSVLNVFVFLIPIESGEKISYGITVLLSFAVFMSFIKDMLPQTSESVSLLAVYLASMLILSATFVCLTVVTTRVYYNGELGIPVPRWIQSVTVGIECLVCNSKKSEKIGVTSVHPLPQHGNDQKQKCKNMVDMKLQRKLDGMCWDEEFTWKRVSRALDNLLFWVFFLSIMTVTVVVMVRMTMTESKTDLNSVANK